MLELVDEQKYKDYISFLSNEGKSLATQSQYCAMIEQLEEHLKQNKNKLGVTGINEFLETFESSISKARAFSIIKSYLLFLKSSIYFELDKIVTVEKA